MTERVVHSPPAFPDDPESFSLACPGLPESSDSDLTWVRWLGRIPIIDYVAVSNWGIIVHRLLEKRVDENGVTCRSFSNARCARRAAAEVELQSVEAQWSYARKELERIEELLHHRYEVYADTYDVWHNARIRTRRFETRLNELNSLLSPPTTYGI